MAQLSTAMVAVAVEEVFEGDYLPLEAKSVQELNLTYATAKQMC